MSLISKNLKFFKRKVRKAEKKLNFKKEEKKQTTLTLRRGRKNNFIFKKNVSIVHKQ